MKKKTKIILGLVGACALCLGLSACREETELDKYEKQGYTISVTYDANGGTFFEREGVTLVDMFRPSDYEPDEDGEIHIKLLEPTDTGRPGSGGSAISCTKTSHFFAGWYKTRELVKNENGNAVDKDGNELEERNGSYYYPGSETKGDPTYIYSDYWDFETDTLDYSEEDGKVSLTLYAGWVPYYEFNYYYQKDGEWTLYGTTSFDYKAVNAPDSKTADEDTIWIPKWNDGAMSYEHSYSSGDSYSFPDLEDTTFNSAYTDEACTQEITESFEHQGTLDIEHGVAVNRVQNIYVKLDEGERYKIENAQQLVANPNVKGYYEILNDLDFTGLKWPEAFTKNSFTGKIYTSDGKQRTMKNISASISISDKSFGGLFGEISENAEIKNISFENAVVDFSSVTYRQSGATFGLFAGNIAEQAKIENVSVSGILRLGKISLGSDYKFNLLANGNCSGIIQNEIRLQAYGQDMFNGQYRYTFEPESVSVDKDGNISMTFGTIYKETESYDIQ